jgi:hypothetical protein
MKLQSFMLRCDAPSWGFYENHLPPGRPVLPEDSSLRPGEAEQQALRVVAETSVVVHGGQFAAVLRGLTSTPFFKKSRPNAN